MRARLPFFIVTAFFVTMNVLLWRSEFGDHHQFGASLPADSVWEKVLTSPDYSALTIRHHGRKIGTCNWTPSVGQERAAKMLTEDAPPEGMIEEPTGYNIDLNGVIFVEELNRVRFSFDLRLSTNQVWQELALRVVLRPSEWRLRAVAAEQAVHLRIDDGQERSEKAFTFADLQHPEKILKELGGPLLPAALSSLGLTTPSALTAGRSRATVGLKWEARYDRLKVGEEWIRVIRMRAHLLDRFGIVLFVSPVGEILKVELPDDIILMNDALSNLSGPEDDRTHSRR